jgi:hypothetical protein
MILRRLAEQLKQQNWIAIGVELVIVVLGVFIGLQVSNWNEARTERATEAAYLRALQEDVDYSISSLQQLIRHMDAQQLAREKLYRHATDPKVTLAPDERDRLLLFGLFQLPQVDISEVTFETLKSSGRLSSLRSPELVSELQSLSASIASALRTQTDELQVTYLFSDPLLIGNIDMAGVFRQPNLYGKPNVPWLKDAPDSAPTPEVMRSGEFANVLLYRAFFTNLRLSSVRSILEQHQRIAALIEARQVELGIKP